MKKDLSLKTKLTIAAAVCLLLPVAMWMVLFFSNRSVEGRLGKSERDLARVSSLRALISLTEKITSPVLNAADYGSEIDDRAAEYQAASASATAGMTRLEELFTPEEAVVSGYADVRDRLVGVAKDAGRMLQILKDPKGRKAQGLDAEFDGLHSSLSGKASGLRSRARPRTSSIHFTG